MASLLSELLSPFRRSLPSYSSTLYQPAPWLSEALGAIPSESGVSVSERTAVTLSAVWTCVNIISTAIASIPLDVCQDTESGNHQKLYDAQIYKLLHDEPNDEDTSYSFRQKMMGALLLYGNAYAEVQYDGAGRVVALWPWPSSMVQIELLENRGEYRYRIRDRIVDKEDMLHLRGLCYEGLVGLSPIQNMKRVLGLGVATEIYASHFYKQGATSKGVVMYPGKLGEKGKANLAESIGRHNEGLANAHKTMVLEEGAKYVPLTIPQDDAQFIETRKFTRAEIAGLYNVPAMLVPGAEDKAATYASSEQFMREFVDIHLRGWMVLWEQELKRRVLSPGQYCRFDTREFLRADAKARGEFFEKMLQIGVINPAQIAALEGLDVPTKGETYYIAGNNLVPVESIGAKPAPASPAPTDKQPPLDNATDSVPDDMGTSMRTVKKPIVKKQIGRGLKGLLAGALRDIQGWEFFSEKRAVNKIKPILRAMADEEMAAEPLIALLSEGLASRIRSLSADGAVEAEVESVTGEIVKVLAP